MRTDEEIFIDFVYFSGIFAMACIANSTNISACVCMSTGSLLKLFLYGKVWQRRCNLVRVIRMFLVEPVFCSKQNKLSQNSRQFI